MIVVYAAGVFDILHKGHVRYLIKARKLGDFLIVGVLTDEGTRAYKPEYPVRDFNDRAEVVFQLKPVDMILPQHNTDPTENLKMLYETKQLQPKILVRGSDVKQPVYGQEYIESMGGKVVQVDYFKDISSSAIKEKIVRDHGNNSK